MSSMCPSVSSPTIPSPSHRTFSLRDSLSSTVRFRSRLRCGLRFGFSRHCSVVSTQPAPLTSIEPPSITIPGENRRSFRNRFQPSRHVVVLLQLLVLVSPGIEDPIVKSAPRRYRSNQKVWTIVANPRINSLDMMKANVCAAVAKLQRLRTACSVSSSSTSRLTVSCGVSAAIICEIDLFDLRHSIGPCFRILGPGQPGRLSADATPPACGSRVPLECLSVLHPSRVSDLRALSRKYL